MGICRGTAARSLLISRDDASFQKQTLRLVDSCSSIQSQVASRRFFDVKVKSVSPSLRRPLHFVNRCLVLLVEHIIDRILQTICLHDRSCGRSHYQLGRQQLARLCLLVSRCCLHIPLLLPFAGIEGCQVGRRIDFATLQQNVIIGEFISCVSAV